MDSGRKMPTQRAREISSLQHNAETESEKNNHFTEKCQHREQENKHLTEKCQCREQEK